MAKHIGKRLLQFIPVLIGITLLTFVLLQLAPGDPATSRLAAGGITPTAEALAKTRHEMGLDKPVVIQYVDWIKDMLTGNFGNSYITDQPVSKLIADALPYTLRMAFLSMIFALLISIPTGIYTAAHKDSFGDSIARGFSFIGNALPNFIIAIFLLYVFSYKLAIIPILSVTEIRGMILPTVTLALVMSSRFIRQIRAATLDELSKDYVVGLRARGISERDILYKNVLKNIMVTLITIVGFSMGSLLGGTVVVETIFNWPGLGDMAMEAISRRDYPVVQGFVVWMSIMYMVINLITDISYTWFNPKIKEI